MRIYRVEIIAEIGSNHEGSLDKALELIDAVSVPATHVKFQLFNPEQLYNQNPRLAHRARMQSIPVEWVPVLRDFSHKLGLEFGCSIFHPGFLRLVDDWDFVKLASGTYLDEDLHRAVERLGIPIIASIPAARSVYPWLEWHRSSMTSKLFTILVCSTQYPTPVWDAGIQRVRTLSEWSYVEDRGITVGYSDHTMSLDMGAFVYCLGGRAVEKHVKLSSSCYAPDGPIAITPSELFRYVQHIHNAADALRIPAPLEWELGRITQEEGNRTDE